MTPATMSAAVAAETGMSREAVAPATASFMGKLDVTVPMAMIPTVVPTAPASPADIVQRTIGGITI